MARVIRQGLDYFPLDCHLDEKVKLVEVKYKNDGFTVIIKLLQRIYSNGFYCKFSEDEILLFAYEINMDMEKVKLILEECLTRGVFNKEKYDLYKILTSKGIQCRYKEAVLRRKDVEIKEEYLLVDNNFGVKTVKKIQDVDIVTTSSEHDDNKSTQTKVKERKVKETKIKDNTEIMLVEGIWSLYPNKKGKAAAIKQIPKLIKEYSKEEIIRCVERYSKECKDKNTEIQYIKNGSTFFNGGYMDYLDSNSVEPVKEIKKDRFKGLTPEEIYFIKKAEAEARGERYGE